MAVSKRLRFEVFKRDKFTCQYCGRRPPDVMLEADHVVAKSAGGPDTMENLTTSCLTCNRGKAAKGLGDVAPALGEMEQLEAFQEMLERKRDMVEQIAVAQGMREAEDSAIEYVKGLWVDSSGSDDGFDWESVRRFLARGISVDDMRRAMATTRSRHISSGWKAWKYFCKICWNWIRERNAPTTEPDAES